MSKDAAAEEAKDAAPHTVDKPTSDFPKINGNYASRKLDICHFCAQKFNVGERIPRIIVGCGHTFCTSCLSYFLRNYRIRCPMCRKLLKGVDSVDKLPLNFNILYEVVTNDPLLASVNFEKCLQAEQDFESDEAYERECAMYICQKHEQRIKHFYCSEHPSIFCRECIKDLHNMDACFVVDLYEIEKMRKMQQQNNELNQRQLSRRQDGACESYIQPTKLPSFKNPLLEQVQEPKEVKPAPLQSRRPHHDPTSQGYFQPQTVPAAATGAAIVEFDATQFDAQGVSLQDKAQLLAAQHHQMLTSGAGNQNFPANKNFGYGQGYNSFSDEEEDDNGEGEDNSSEYEEGELNSAQKQKLKRDLLMMGYDEQGDDDGEDEEAALIANAAVEQQRLLMMQADPQQQQLLLQQMQFQEAMRIQMAMKQMPVEGQLAAGPAPAGLRTKNMPAAAAQDPLNFAPSDEPDNQEAQQKQFELDKKLFAQQMKEELLGRKTAKPAIAQTAEEKKAHETIAVESGEENDAAGADDSFDSQIEVGAANLISGEKADVLVDSFQTPPVQKHSNQEDTPVSPAPVTDESQKSVVKVAAADSEEPPRKEELMKENTAPEKDAAAAGAQ